MTNRALVECAAGGIALTILLAVAVQRPAIGRSAVFSPHHRLSGIGVSRAQLSDEALKRRTELMIESQTFAILRDPRAVSGAERITSPTLDKLFRAAERQSGTPASLIAAIAYLESWGDPKAQSPAGPKGIMQIAAGTARTMGLRIRYATRYRIKTERRAVKSKRGKVTYRKVRRRIPYTVLVSDDRLSPQKAVPAAARYLSRLTEKFGGEDWAVFAYHCGEGCTGDIRAIAADARDIPQPASVASTFFGGSPAFNKELHQAVRYHMERDYSPTYWFRIMRARQLLEMYKKDRQTFLKLAEEYRNRVEPSERSPHRLAVWLKPEDVLFQTCDDIKRESGRKLARAFDDPDYFGFALRKSGKNALGWDDMENQDSYFQASPAAIGTLAYIAYETRRMHEAMRTKNERYVPLEVTSLVRPLDKVKSNGDMARRSEAEAHCTGQVFDLNYGDLPAGQREALRFVLDDMGWLGYLGFVEETPNSETLHIGCSPSAREFFTNVYNEALAATDES